jgi:spore maturation protein CgeB
VPASLDIAFFGSSLVSSYRNSAATYFRGLLHTLARRGHRITFHEPDAFDRQNHRDIPDPDWARVVVYPAQTPDGALSVVEQASRRADLVIKAGGVGVHDALLEEAVLAHRRPRVRVVFWDMDADATLARVHADFADPFRALVPRYDYIFTRGGGASVVAAYRALGAPRCAPICPALDPSAHFPVPPERELRADLGFLGDRLPDHERRVEEFFLNVAAARPDLGFLLGGGGWEDRPVSPNVRRLGHVGSARHNAFNCSVRAVLDVHRDHPGRHGFFPTDRLFEAAGAGACLITDRREGVEQFLEPGREVLVAADGAEVLDHLDRLAPARATAIGKAAFHRLLAEHTYGHRVVQLEQLLDLRPSPHASA